MKKNLNKSGKINMGESFRKSFELFEKVNISNLNTFQTLNSNLNTFNTLGKLNTQMKTFNENLYKLGKASKISFPTYYSFKKINKIGKSVKTINQTIENVFKPLSTVLDKTFKILEEIDLEKLKDKGKRKVIPLIYTYMWAIPPHFSSDELEELIFMSALNIKYSQEDIDEFFIEYFKKDNFEELWRFFYIWEKYLSEEREKIIFDIFALISSKNISREIENVYSIVIPTLITQIDGLIVDKLGYRTNSREKKEKLEEFFNIFLAKNINDSFSKNYLSTNFKIFAEKFFQNSDDAEKENNNFNRHLILHGNTLDYGTEANFYRLVIILDFIITVLYIENTSLESF